MAITKIFVDDMRVPLDSDWVLASTVAEAIGIIEQSDNFILSLDHDLGEKEGQGDTTRPLIQWCIDNNRVPVAAAVHSSNPVGAQWLRQALEHDFDNPVPKIPIPQWGL